MACPSGKRQYRTRLDAEIVLALRIGRKAHRREKNELRAYWCRDCRHWHLTSRNLPATTHVRIIRDDEGQ